MAEAEGGSEQDDVSFLRTVSRIRLYFQMESEYNVISGRHGLSVMHGNR